MPSVTLHCHPSQPSDAIRELTVQVDRIGQRLSVRYAVRGEIGDIRIPATAQSQRRDKLWQHTCFECFVKAPTGAGYCELNFSPSSEWAAYRFDDYRQGAADLPLAVPPAVVIRRDDRRLELEAEVDMATVAELCASSQLALSAVIEDSRGRLSYWALAHPLERPDFHHPGGFVLSLP
jgi:hypothetical protein